MTTKKENRMTPVSTDALKSMVERLDKRDRDALGYVTFTPEIQRILSELSPNLSAVILETPTPVEAIGDISVEIKISFSLSRSELQ